MDLLLFATTLLFTEFVLTLVCGFAVASDDVLFAVLFSGIVFSTVSSNTVG